MEDVLSAGTLGNKIFQERKVKSFKSMPARREKIQSLSVLQKESFLGLMNDKLGTEIKVLFLMLVGDNVSASFVLNYTDQFHIIASFPLKQQ